METVTVLPPVLPQGRGLTREDLQVMPDDGYRYELLDGSLIVSPSPRWPHQRAVGRLYGLLGAAAPDSLEVFVAPLDVELAIDTVLQPDVLVVRRSDLGDHGIKAAPVLAVEVLSPSTRLFDLNTKKARFEQARCPSYWVVDPDPDNPALVAWDLVDGVYVEVARASGTQVVLLDQPYPVTLVPADLVV
jgi:Uma2 family endonuclease